MGNRIAELASRIHAATYELLVLIRDFDAAGAWSGFTSCAAWLSWRTGLEAGAAREHVRVAHALAQLPKVSGAMRRGRVSYSKVRAITRVATPETEQTLLDVALAGTAAHVERVVRAWRQTDRAAEGIEDRVRQAGRSLHAWVDDDGMVVVRGRLTPEVGSVFRRALEAAVAADAAAAGATDGGAAAAAGATGGGAAGTADGAAGATGRGAAAGATSGGAAGATGRGAAAGATSGGAAGTADGGGKDAVDEAAGVERSLGQRQADALGQLAECALASGLDRGTAGDRYQVVLHVDAETLAEDGAADDNEDAARGSDALARGTTADAAGGGSDALARSTTDAAGGGSDGRDVPAGTQPPVRRAVAGCPGPRTGGRQAALAEDGGIRVGQETARRIACDAATVTMRHGPDGDVLDVGRRTRTVSPALRRALAARDGQCRFPGCAARRCDAHHVRHWADGGKTALSNLVLLCRRHHRAVHEDGFQVRVDAGGAMTFLRPDGRPLAEAPAAPAWSGPALAPVDGRLRAAGIDIDADTAPRWQGERLDLGWAIDVLWRPRAAAPATGVPAGTPAP